MRMGQKQQREVAPVGAALGLSFAGRERDHLLCNQLFWCRDTDFGDKLIGRELGHLTHIDQVSVLWLAELENTKAAARCHLSDADSDCELPREVRANFLRQTRGA